MTYYDKEGTILLDSSTDIGVIPPIGSLIDFGSTYNPDYYVVISHVYYPHAGFGGLIVDKVDPLLDGNLADFRISAWAYEIYRKRLKEGSPLIK